MIHEIHEIRGDEYTDVLASWDIKSVCSIIREIHGLELNVAPQLYNWIGPLLEWVLYLVSSININTNV